MSTSHEYQGNPPTRLWKIVPFTMAAAMLLAGCGGEEKKDAASKQAAAPTVSVVVTPVVQKTVPLFTELTARTDATDSVDIRARVKAFLLTQNYSEGTMVKKGQVLF